MSWWQRRNLKDCPFCGGLADYFKQSPPWGIGKAMWSVGCTNDACPVHPETPAYQQKEDAEDAWNTRPEKKGWFG